MNRLLLKRLFPALALAALLLALAAPAALAAPGLPDEIIVGEDYTLAAGQTLNGNLTVYGGNATLGAGSHVTGDVVMVGGNLDASGEIGGNVVMIAGDATLHDSAVVDGDLVTTGGDVQRDPGAVVKGHDINTFGPRSPFNDFMSRAPFGHWLDLAGLGLSRLLRSFGWAITMGVLALLVLVFWPDQTARVGQAVMTAPFAAGGMGLLTFIAGGLLFSVLILALCLGFFGWLALGAAALFGWIALGSLAGTRLAAPLRLNNLHPAATGALGTFLLTLVVEFLRVIPCLGALLAMVLASLGLGAVVLTRFGTRAYLRALPPAPPPAPTPPAAPAEAP
jgi:hypothetical protein